MALTRSNRYMNWSGTMFATVAVDGVKRVGLDRGIQDLQEGADMDLGPTISLITHQNPSFTVTTINAGVLVNLAEGVRGVFTTTMNDARNQAATGGGGYVFTTNAQSFIGADAIEGEYMGLTTDSFTVKTNWSDGVTNPIGVSAL